MRAEVLMRHALAVLILATAAPALAEPRPSPVSETLATWSEEARKLVAMAKDFPDAKFDYKPSPEMRSFADQLLHVAGGNRGFLSAAQGKKFDESLPLPRAQYDTKAKIVALLEQSIADDAAYIGKLGDAGLRQAMKSPWDANKIVTPEAYWLDAATHMAEHYGQLVVYYRLNKLVPPESRPKK
jgi:uncharacterized damage-inducible protein DinB